VQNLRLLEPLNIPYDARAARYVFPLSPEEHAAAENFLAAHGLGHAPLLGFHPGSPEDMKFKRWPPERWIQLGGELARAYDAKILVFGGEAEHELRQRVRDGIGDAAVEVKGSLRQSAAIARRCLLFVSNDSGLMHVAVSQNVPTFGLFGPTDETRTAPWGPYGHVIRAVGTQPTYDLSAPRSREQFERVAPSLLTLTVDEVLRRVTEQVPPGARYSS
jgi:heptosyltransferase-2